MRVHHLNTGTMCPASARLVNGRGRLLQKARLVCHVFLIETARDGLVLVDTGLGTGDVADPARLGPSWVRMSRPILDPTETALARVRALGHSPDDVRHIAVTHLDLDHAGGIPDFPKAAIHVHRREHTAAMARRTKRARYRYIPGHWSHDPDWRLYDDGGDTWFGFEGVRPLLRDPDILLIPLPGHTPGHTGIAVQAGDRWLLHAGDAYFFHAQLDANPTIPFVLSLFQRRVDTDRRQRKANQDRLRRLKADRGHEIEIVNGHDPVDFDRAAAACVTGQAADAPSLNGAPASRY